MLRDGKRLDLTPKTFDVLQMLVERPGEVVTKDELFGNAYFADSQRDKAIYLYQKCLQLNPEFVKAMDDLGVV